jgi:hypothetical protein
MISIYLWVGEGLSDRNLEILAKAAAVVLSHGGPWLIGGDFNMESSELSGASEILRRMKGVVVVPSGTTCKSRPGGSVIDYFVIDRRLQGSIEDCFADASMTSSPHDAVVLILRTDASQSWTRTLEKAKSFPACRPIGCAREPTTDFLVPGRELLDETFVHDLKPEDLAGAYGALLAEADRELCKMCDEVDDEGEPDPRFLGHGAKPSFKWIRNIPEGSNDEGAVDGVGLAWQQLGNRVREMVSLIKVVEAGWHFSRAREQQWFAIQ